MPWPRRWLLARRPALARGVLRRALAEVTRWLRRAGGHRGTGGEPGTVTVMQRFGTALNLNLHFHILLLDGLYVAEADDRPRFRRARRWRQGDVDALIVRIAARCEAWLARHGVGRESDTQAGDASGRGRAAVDEGGRQALALDAVECAVVARVRGQRHGVPDVRQGDGAARRHATARGA